ncbi:hypothetical protein CCDG5_0646 [[Clostridium] cellulosi]|uniref:Uncharacterized protein n=1 Tax=[Clostridium] cellulosi TaxID=29343 RepID=A0A078KJG7_9FIRM|nr:hypothetical protein CCDG5_0646 [[Clostridium] cellulosi]
MENNHEIVQGTIKFYDSKEEARRLLLVAGMTETGEYICFNITSDKTYKDNKKYPGSVFVSKTKENGLHHDSYVKTDIEYIIDPASVYSDVKKLGIRLSDADFNRVMARYELLKGENKVRRVYNKADSHDTEFDKIKRSIIKEIENYKRDPRLMAELIDFKAKFWNYSLNNTILIYKQNRGATYVAGYRRWKDLGYNVKRGEKAIRILRPYEVTYYKDPQTEEWKNVRYVPREMLDKIYSNEIETQKRTYYTTAYVFDISQTTCPTSDYPKFYDMGYDSGGHAVIYDSLKSFAIMSGLRVIEDNVHSIALKGFYSPSNSTITINNLLNDSEKVATMVHEFAHALMHKTSTQPKEIMEFEAEVLSHMIQRRLNLPLSDMNKDYLAQYYDKIKGNNIPIEKCFRRISKAYNHITQGLDKELENRGITIGRDRYQNRERAQQQKPKKEQVKENFFNGLEE